MKVSLFRTLPALLLLASAVGAQPLTIKESTDYFPLKEGNTWTYKVTGGKLNTNPIVMKVVGFEKSGELVCARVNTYRGGELNGTELYTVDKEGVYRVEVGGTKLDKPMKLIKLPFKDKENWKVDFKIGDRKVENAVFVAGTEKGVKVPAGTYDTITVTSKDLKIDVKVDGAETKHELNTTYWFAEKVGMVKNVVSVGGITVTLELEKFEEGKK